MKLSTITATLALSAGVASDRSLSEQTAHSIGDGSGVVSRAADTSAPEITLGPWFPPKQENKEMVATEECPPLLSNQTIIIGGMEYVLHETHPDVVCLLKHQISAIEQEKATCERKLAVCRQSEILSAWQNLLSSLKWFLWSAFVMGGVYVFYITNGHRVRRFTATQR